MYIVIFTHTHTHTHTAGVPDAPVITLAISLLTWSEPDNNGQPIDLYSITAKYV